VVRHAAVCWLITSAIFPPVDPAQLDLAARYQAEEQDRCRIFARQRALPAAAKFFVKPRRSQCESDEGSRPLREIESPTTLIDSHDRLPMNGQYPDATGSCRLGLPRTAVGDYCDSRVSQSGRLPDNH